MHLMDLVLKDYLHSKFNFQMSLFSKGSTLNLLILITVVVRIVEMLK